MSHGYDESVEGWEISEPTGLEHHALSVEQRFMSEDIERQYTPYETQTCSCIGNDWRQEDTNILDDILAYLDVIRFADWVRSYDPRS